MGGGCGMCARHAMSIRQNGLIIAAGSGRGATVKRALSQPLGDFFEFDLRRKWRKGGRRDTERWTERVPTITQSALALGMRSGTHCGKSSNSWEIPRNCQTGIGSRQGQVFVQGVAIHCLFLVPQPLIATLGGRSSSFYCIVYQTT